MQRLKTKVLQTFGGALVALLALPQFAVAQHRLTPIPHPIGAPQSRPVQAAAQGLARADVAPDSATSP